MPKPITKYICQNCSYVSVRWLGKCPECSSWNSFVEEIVHIDKRKITSKSRDTIDFKITNLSKVSEIDIKEDKRTSTHINELDRVLGGGIVAGSVILVGGDPGIGKSTSTLATYSKQNSRSSANPSRLLANYIWFGTCGSPEDFCFYRRLIYPS